MKKNTVLNFLTNVSGEGPALRSKAPPLRAALARLEAFTPPPKPPELLEAERAQADAVKARTAAKAEAVEVGRILVRQENEPNYRGPRFSMDDGRQLNQRVKDAEAEVIRCRERVAELSEPWRAETQRLVLQEFDIVRAALHPLCRDLEDAFAALRDIAAKMAAIRVGSPWLARQAANPLLQIAILKDVLELDRKLMQ